ncbi:alpha-2-macroglobulin-like isoform X2 [Hyla sarda]|nr:alpha-2-macroglobulin-like isoform X2 [Hyla sarda]
MNQDRCIIQMDKFIYKPGDTVRFRLISVDPGYNVENKIHPLVEISDPNKHRIKQWLNVSSGFSDFSFQLANEISLGEYKINVPPFCEKRFKVEEYVLKRFEVNIDLPPSVALIDKTVHMEVCGRYTYGKPVEGSIDLSICLSERFHRKWASSDSSSEEDEDKINCISIKKAKTDSKGCVIKDIDLGLFNFSKSNHYQFLLFQSSLKEDHTGHIEKASADVILKMHKKVQFTDRLQTYQKGHLHHSKVKVTDEKDKPVSNQAVYLHIGNPFSGFEKLQETELTDENGIADFTLNTSTWDSFLVLKATLSPEENDDDDDDDENRYLRDTAMLGQFYSLSESQLSIKGQSTEIMCDSDETLTVEYEIQRKALDSDTDHLHFISLLRNSDGILLYKEHKIDIKDQSNNPTVHGSFPVSFHVDEKVFPWLLLLVFSVLPNGETIASIAPYEEMPLCIKEKVKLKFSEEQVLPGASVNLEVSAIAGSLCSIRSVDKGHLLQIPEKSSLRSQYKEMLQSLHMSFLGIGGQELRERPQCPENTIAEIEQVFHILDVDMIFMYTGLRIFTNTHIKKPVKCIPSTLGARSGIKMKQPGDKDKEISERFTRRYFPVSWLFEVVPVGSEGHTVLSRTTPHSITKWVTEAFCLDKNGFAIAGEVELTTFQPYFIDLIVPKSVVQGEKFTIQAVVFNYVKKCILIVASLADSEEFVTVKNKEQARCVCEGHSHSFTWDVTAIKLKAIKIHVDSGSLEVDGKCTEDPILIKNDERKDSVEKTIVVKPRGHEEEKTRTFILYPSENKEDIHITLNLPERLVEGSERAHVIIHGDLMANIILNLKDIIHLPDSCGEQNAAKFARYVYALEYLESIQELTPEKKAKIIESLVEAYQKQLTFGHKSGSYGYFSSSPNLWVTAFVLKTFISAQKWIYIEEENIQECVEWLQSLQLPDGCFSPVGYLFNNAIKDSEVSRTAYVVIALLEAPRTYNGSIVENALSCLRKSVDNDTSVHTQALLAYAFTLSGDNELRDHILKKLDESAIKKEGTKRWETTDFVGNIETHSYIILALLSDKTTTPKHVEESTDIIRWIMNWQNPYGGFQSSQDTTLALQALAKYARATRHKKGDSTVTIHSKSGFKKTVHVDKSNSLLVQTVDLPEIPGEYIVSATGDGFVYLQSHMHYHTLPDASERGHFSLNVSTTPSVCTQESQRKFDIHVDVRYSGNREYTNMAIIIIEPVSGYSPDRNSVKKLKNNSAVSRTEVSAEKISIYMDKLTHDSESLVFSLEQETNVENLQPATVVVYDYYFPDEHTVVEYNAPCSAESKKTDNH